MSTGGAHIITPTHSLSLRLNLRLRQNGTPPPGLRCVGRDNLCVPTRWKRLNGVANGEDCLTAVHGDVWRGSAGQDSPVSGQGEALCWLRPSSQAIHVAGLQHQLLPTAGEER